MLNLDLLFLTLMKDNFSTGSDNYAHYRPSYPKAFFEYLFSLLPQKRVAWDCATGSGQIAAELSKGFEKVYATDISQSQIAHAVQLDNIEYSVQAAEQTHFEKELFDLVTVGQAIHWFDFDRFYEEVRRTSKKEGLICVVGYGLVRVDSAIDAVVDDFYKNIIGPYWDAERRYVDENYLSIPFPFKEVKAPKFQNDQSWTLLHFMGYLNTWSAVKHYKKATGLDPMPALQERLEKYWGLEEVKSLFFPILLRIGHVNS